ncbi:MAG: PEP-CTERM sorting domain-containing protein [Crocosphaera sp.]|nr:PEP-CTERM sorting domain-containing protein [Crocosphaera sp.]
MKPITQLIIPSLVMGLFANLSTAQAAIISYDMQGQIATGEPSLIGESYSGSFSFDDVSGEVESITFNLLGSTFTEVDADIMPTVEFFDGDFLGLDYTVTVGDIDFPLASFALISGFFAVEDALFDYTPRTGNAGIGSITYSLSPVASIPEPSVTMSLFFLGLFGIITHKNKHP